MHSSCVVCPCSVQIVTEGLRGKTRWWRKTPLELSHPTRALLGNERSLMLFAAGSAAKEQWFTVLGRGSGIDGEWLHCPQWRDHVTLL